MPTSPPGEFTPQQACPGWSQGNCSLRWSRIVCKRARAMTLPVLPSVTLCLSPIPSAIIKCLQHTSAGTVQGSKGYSRFTANEPWGQAGELVPSRHQKWEKNGVKAGTEHCLPKSSCCFNKKESRPNLFSFFILLWHCRDKSSSWILNYPVKIVSLLLFHPRGRTASSFLSILMVFITKTEERMPWVSACPRHIVYSVTRQHPPDFDQKHHPAHPPHLMST